MSVPPKGDMHLRYCCLATFFYFFIRSRFFLASAPKLMHASGSDLGFLPDLVRVDASAASIYDNNDMLCSIVGESDPEVKEVAI